MLKVWLATGLAEFLGEQVWGDSETGPGNALIDMQREIDCLHCCAIQITNYRSQAPSHDRTSTINSKWRGGDKGAGGGFVRVRSAEVTSEQSPSCWKVAGLGPV